MIRRAPPPGATATGIIPAPTSSVPIRSGQPGALQGDAREARAAAASTRIHAAQLPDWSGQYERDKTKTATWYYGAVLQIPTYLSLLTPEYQQRFVQQMYHESGDNTPQWPGKYCWPEGFMRRFAQYGGTRMNLVVSPDLVLDMRNAAKTLVTQIHIGREFNETDTVPRLGRRIAAMVRRDHRLLGRRGADHLDLQHPGLDQHGGAEYSSHLQTVEIYTPRKDGTASSPVCGTKRCCMTTRRWSTRCAS